jgi:hypothetical protein
MPTERKYTFNVDTKRYLTRIDTYRSLIGISPITNSDAVDIDNFIIGLKDLGLWHNIICYLFRSIHNIGSGATALSLGGGQQVGANATLLNSATWSTDGITRTAAAGSLFSTTIRDIGVAPVAHGAVLKNATDLGSNVGYWYTAGVNVSGRQFSIGNSASTNSQNLVSYVSLWPPGVGSLSVLSLGGGTSTPFTRTGRHYFSIRPTSGTTARFTLNTNQANQSSAGSDWNSSNPSFVRFTPSTALGLTASFVFLSNSLVSDTQDASLYRLIKDTVGKNLALP